MIWKRIAGLSLVVEDYSLERLEAFERITTSSCCRRGGDRRERGHHERRRDARRGCVPRPSRGRGRWRASATTWRRWTTGRARRSSGSPPATSVSGPSRPRRWTSRCARPGRRCPTCWVALASTTAVRQLARARRSALGGEDRAARGAQSDGRLQARRRGLVDAGDRGRAGFFGPRADGRLQGPLRAGGPGGRHAGGDVPRGARRCSRRRCSRTRTTCRRSTRCWSPSAIGSPLMLRSRAWADTRRRPINVKPSRIGGLRPLLEIYEHCAANGHRDVRRRDGRARHCPAARSSCWRRCLHRTPTTTSRPRSSTPRSSRPALPSSPLVPPELLAGLPLGLTHSSVG